MFGRVAEGELERVAVEEAGCLREAKIINIQSTNAAD